MEKKTAGKRGGTGKRQSGSHSVKNFSRNFSAIVKRERSDAIYNTMKKLQVAIFAAGCFWGVEEAFQKLPGVHDTEAGYTGGSKEEPTYEDVCGGKTGHAESVRVEFDPKKITYADLLGKFFAMHDPTSKNRQGLDIGAQYRSAIFFQGKEQEREARRAIAALSKSGKYRLPIVTEVLPAQEFWPAEEYHQKYLQKRSQAVCKVCP
ncbi:MAG: peptide-methionine (S)-S-oxide reductase MsrA [Candidatus Micrarchaeia archaeon]|jgi:peptide-methionine (S)-S-oxide reductase